MMGLLFIFMLLMIVGVAGLAGGLLLGAAKLVFRFSFWIIQLVAVVLGFALFGGGLLALAGLLVACNLVGLPILLLRRH